jgi:hypothetical protein
MEATMRGDVREISRKINAPGYVLDMPSMDRILDTAKAAVEGGDKVVVDISAELVGPTRQRLTFGSMAAFRAYADNGDDRIHSLDLEVRNEDQSGIRVQFGAAGAIRVDAFGRGADFAFRTDRVMRTVEQCTESYSWMIRNLVFFAPVLRVIAMAIMLAAMVFAGNTAYYLFARSEGVDVNPSVLPEGNQYAREVEHALQKGTTEDKLNVLLRGQLRNFTNVSDILRRQRQWATASGGILMFLLVSLLLLRGLRKLYPMSSFAFGLQVKALERLRQGRQLWTVAVLLGFVVNVFAGIAVALAFR